MAASVTDTRTLSKPPAVRRRTVPSVGRPGAGWAIPGLVFFGIFALLPMAGVVYLSLTSWDGVTAPQYIGMHNWSRFLGDHQIVQSTIVTGVLLLGNIAVQAPISILLGVWAAGKQRNRAILSAIFFLPLLLSTAATSVMWRQLLDPNFGLPSKMSWLFLGDQNMLGTQTGAIVCLIAVTSWQFVPFHSLLYQGAARNVPATLYQAAALDGAGRARQFFSITLPLLRNTIITSTTFRSTSCCC